MKYLVRLRKGGQRKNPDDGKIVGELLTHGVSKQAAIAQGKKLVGAVGPGIKVTVAPAEAAGASVQGTSRTNPKRRRNGYEDDESVAAELVQSTDSMGELYPMKQAIQKSLLKKMKAGKYNSTFAPKAFAYLAEAGAKQYVKEHDAPGAKWSNVFPKKIRDLASRMWVEQFEAEAALGNFDYLLGPKKNPDLGNASWLSHKMTLSLRQPTKLPMPVSTLRAQAAATAKALAPGLSTPPSGALAGMRSNPKRKANPLKLKQADIGVIIDFLNGRPGSSDKLSTDGKRLDGNWMGGSGIARHGGAPFGQGIDMPDLGSKAADLVQKRITKIITARQGGNLGDYLAGTTNEKGRVRGKRVKNSARKQRNPSAYTAFVKEHLKPLIDGGMKAKDAMREVAAAWRAAKSA